MENTKLNFQSKIFLKKIIYKTKTDGEKLKKNGYMRNIERKAQHEIIQNRKIPSIYYIIKVISDNPMFYGKSSRKPHVL